MKLLLDTQILLWAAGQPEKLSVAARKQLNNQNNELLFSAASIWEIAIKNTLGRDDFRVEPRLLRRGLLDNGYTELPITSEHAVNVDGLPPPAQRPVRSHPACAGSDRGDHASHQRRATGSLPWARAKGVGGRDIFSRSPSASRSMRGDPVQRDFKYSISALFSSSLRPRFLNAS